MRNSEGYGISPSPSGYQGMSGSQNNRRHGDFDSEGNPVEDPLHSEPLTADASKARLQRLFARPKASKSRESQEHLVRPKSAFVKKQNPHRNTLIPSFPSVLPAVKRQGRPRTAEERGFRENPFRAAGQCRPHPSQAALDLRLVFHEPHSFGDVKGMARERAAPRFTLRASEGGGDGPRRRRGASFDEEARRQSEAAVTPQQRAAVAGVGEGAGGGGGGGGGFPMGARTRGFFDELEGAPPAEALLKMDIRESPLPSRRESRAQGQSHGSLRRPSTAPAPSSAAAAARAWHGPSSSSSPPPPLLRETWDARKDRARARREGLRRDKTLRVERSVLAREERARQRDAQARCCRRQRMGLLLTAVGAPARRWWAALELARGREAARRWERARGRAAAAIQFWWRRRKVDRLLAGNRRAMGAMRKFCRLQLARLVHQRCHYSVDLLADFLRRARKVSGARTAAMKFRARLARLQRWCRGWVRCRRDRLKALELKFARVEEELGLETRRRKLAAEMQGRRAAAAARGGGRQLNKEYLRNANKKMQATQEKMKKMMEEKKHLFDMLESKEKKEGENGAPPDEIAEAPSLTAQVDIQRSRAAALGRYLAARRRRHGREDHARWRAAQTRLETITTQDVRNMLKLRTTQELARYSDGSRRRRPRHTHFRLYTLRQGKTPAAAAAAAGTGGGAAAVGGAAAAAASPKRAGSPSAGGGGASLSPSLVPEEGLDPFRALVIREIEKAKKRSQEHHPHHNQKNSAVFGGGVDDEDDAMWFFSK